MATACRGLVKASKTFPFFHKNCVSFSSKITGRRTCFSAPESSEAETFEEMFRKSDFVKLGRPLGKLVAGKITHIVEQEDAIDLYVDFGWKFHAVVTEAKDRKSMYKVDDLVKIKLRTLEDTGHFLGQNKRVTLCEADAQLEGILYPDTTHSIFLKEQSLGAMANSEVNRFSPK
ncbi:PREDICTED: 28S ribosomal protein S28, mitochondrial-like [Acropora digitifera]|uniref:28S ribosomal protein S28, mitochondrial-like n=1 Tax=Acropora digitifera TaxID=70779 RepID=UPI00077AF913|nr:PREDICTED: 28S ribosomal protein S28, mitochondrial-like [Acropora digitifera]XP_015764324.1 PREDICTED: 28S ribosomal protein S28, mitochondrial-like [Acropora digitifera]XP_015764325.1 PREDICTED: 28S ribosomal protein S28, mitochondrial-like [Acropora digitifera]